MIRIGMGHLTWGRSERVSDRYGTFYFMSDRHAAVDITAVHDLDGQQGRLVAKVLETRKSEHVGDLFRGVFPSTPEIGEEIVLGSGIFFSEPCSDGAGGCQIGLRPEKPRETDWLDIHALYRAHEQTVELFFDS